MQMYVVHTHEIDDPKDAVAEVLKALPEHIIKRKRDNHAVGILTTHPDALSSGVVKAICDLLPFDVVGMTCFATAASGINTSAVDLDILSLTVLESDEVCFATAITDVLYAEGADENLYQLSIDKAYAEIKSKFGDDFEKPALTFAFNPFIPEVPGQKVTDYIGEVTNQAPLFGGLASDHTAYGDFTYVIHNCQYAKGKLALLCMSGPIKASFNFLSLEPSASKEVTITESAGTLVSKVNDIAITKHVKTLGISPDEWKRAGIIVPFLVDYKDGSSLTARELLSFNSDGHAVFGGSMPVGSSLYLGLQTADGIVQSATSIINDITVQKDNLLGAIVICCVGRSLLLGANPLKEGQKALELLPENLPYVQFYTRGEICPAQLSNGKLENRFHNFSFTVCMFEKI